jgi:hypothetical protein
MNAIAKSRRRYFYRQWFKTLRGLANFGMKSLTRSELAVYLLLLSETRPDGTARAGLSDLARRVEPSIPSPVASC